MSDGPVLSVENLQVHYPVRTGGVLRGKYRPLKAVDGISFELKRGEVLGIVGESGCGKSSLGRAVMMLNRPTGGDVYWLGTKVTDLNAKALGERRKDVQIVFQDPLASLNPRLTIGESLREPVGAFKPGWTADETRLEIRAILEKVGLLPDVETRYPHELSGGQCQRVSIARAMLLRPKVAVLDEPVSALDVLVQAQIINLLKDLQREFGLSYIMIGHDLSVIRYVCDRVLVIYLGKIVERGTREQLFSTPRHPYTQALLRASPEADPGRALPVRQTLMDADLPSPIDPPSGCRFHTRCPHATTICKTTEPEMDTIRSGHDVMCHHWDRISLPE